METEIIKDCIHRSLALRRYRDRGFACRVRQVEQWKLESLRRCYAPLMEKKADRALFEYYFSDLFCGIDLTELKNADKAVGLIQKFFTGTGMVVSGLQFNALAQETNEKIATVVFEENGLDELNEEIYVTACHSANVIPDLCAQLDSFAEFAADLNSTVENRAVLAGVKLAKIPAKIGGFKNIYNFVADGVNHLKKVEDPEALVALFLAHERQTVLNIQNNSSSIFEVI